MASVTVLPTPTPAVVEAGKDLEAFRIYDEADAEKTPARVLNHYKTMRTRQTLDFVLEMEKTYFTFDRVKMTVWEAFEKLGTFVDGSDPDTDSPNLEHMLQTAESLRAHGKPDWLVLTGLIHDLGKIMFLWGAGKDVGQESGTDAEQWALGGDTWVVGCRIPDSTIMPHLNSLNPDMAHEVYSTPQGIYEPGCGLDSLKFAFGHDEYIYRWAVFNNAKLPKEALACLRYHSCYPLHKEHAYDEFLAEGDEELLEAVREFNEHDLYTKADEEPDVEALKPYYQALIDKYLPGELWW